MSKVLSIDSGFCSEAGRKALNQDFLGVMVPQGYTLGAKGIVAAIADGISSSAVSHLASQSAVRSMFEDYYSTPDSWTVKKAVLRVLQATNAWLHAQSRDGPGRFDRDKGYVCTFSALVFKAGSVHLFHAGDTRIYYVAGQSLECLTRDHRHWNSDGSSYLVRALGMSERLEIDYQRYPVEAGDTFVMMSDGVYEHVPDAEVIAALERHQDDLDEAARQLVALAAANGSEDNLSAQFVRLNALPDPGISELGERVAGLGPPPELAPRMCFEGFSILRELHRSSRSQVMLATDDASGARVVLKLPSASLRNDPAYMEQFALEEWVQRRLQSPHLLGAPDIRRPRRYLYTVTEYIEGQTLEQWMRDNPAADLETVRSIISQVARGLQAMHRQQIIHRDLRPANIMIDRHGSCRIIDFGSVLVAGIAEDAPATAHEIVGTAQYSAPEFYLGEPIGERADQFSLAVITYQLLCGALPYGNSVSRCTSRAAARRLRYRPARSVNPALPDWIDTALETALQPDALRRYEVISEFLQDLRTPAKRYMRSRQRPLIERDPLRFWQGLSLFLVLVIAFLLVSGSGLPRP